MQRKKNQQIAPSYFMIVWLFIVRMLGLATQQPVLPSLPASPPKQKKQTKKLERSSDTSHKEKKEANTAPRSPEKRNSSPDLVSSAPRVLKFSIDIPDKAKKAIESARSSDSAVTKKSKSGKSERSKLSKSVGMFAQQQEQEVKSPPAVQAASAPVSRPRASSFLSPDAPLWRQLKVCVSQTRMQLDSSLPAELLQLPINQLIDNLAFLYRFHLMTLALKSLTREGEDKKTINSIRAVLVHGADFHLFDDPQRILETKKAVAQLDLRELNELSKDKHQLDSFDLSSAMMELPLCQMMRQVAEAKGGQQKIKSSLKISKEECQLWVTHRIIPLINTINRCMQESDNEKYRLACHHALKMLVMMIGEYGPDITEDFDFKKTADLKRVQVSDSGKYEDFIWDCSLLRNFYAHITPTTKNECMEEQFELLLAAAKKVNSKIVLVNDTELQQRLTPHKIRMENQKALQVVARRSPSPTNK